MQVRGSVVTETVVSRDSRAHAPTPSELRLASQRSAFRTLRSHALRGTLRTAVLLLADAAVLLGARGVVRVLRRALPWAEAAVPTGTLGAVEPLVALAVGLTLFGAYREGDRWRSWLRVSQGVGFGIGLILWDSLFSSDPGQALGRWLVISLGLTGLLGTTRAGISLVVAATRGGARSGYRERVVLVVPEDDEDAVRLSRLFGKAGPFHLSATIPFSDGSDADGLSSELLATIDRVRPDTVVVAGYLVGDLWARVLEVTDASGCRLLSMVGHSGSLVTSWRTISYLGIPVTEVTRPQLRFHQLVIKRAFDVVVATLLTIALAPLLVSIGVAVKLSSRGAVLFRQERVGLGGRRFNILKFRSMVVDAEDRLAELDGHSIYSDARLFKVQSDPRVTSIGAFLRTWSLDELPQLLNVLRGDMSLVGPRPPIPREVVLYDAHHYARFDVKPGITGPWQVAGRNEVRDFEEVVVLEQSYIRNWNLGKDLRILLATIPVVLKRRGAF